MVTRRTEPVDFLELVTRELLVTDDARIEGNLTVIGTLSVSSTITFLGTLTVNVGAAATPSFQSQVSAVTRWQVTGDGTMTWHDGAGVADLSLSRTAADVLTLAAGDSFAIADLTTGSVLFAAANGVISQDNANLFWDDGNNRLGIGTLTPDRTLHAEEDDASNASVTEMLRLTHTTSGAPGVGIGAGLEFEVETSAGNNEIGALIEAITTNVGAGTEAFDLAFSTMTAGAAAAQRMLLNAAGLTFPLATTISTSAGGLTITPTTNTFFSNGTGVVIGHTAQITASNTSELQVLGTGGPDGSALIARFSSNSSPPSLNFLKSRNAAIGGNTIVQDNDLIGQVKFLPADGADFSTTAALFLAEVDDASPAAGDIGMAFVWQQMPGGGGAFPIRETMRLTAAGSLTFAQATTISTTAGDLTLAPTGNDVIVPDNTALSLGAGADSRIFYDGTDTFWDLRAVGTGDLLIALAAGFPSPDPNSVHIWRGSAGVIPANASSLLVLEDDAVAYINFLTPNTVAPAILFGDPEANNSGALFYIHTTDTFRFRTGDVNRLDYSAGAFTFLEATTISTTAGNLTLSAVAGSDVIIGDDVGILFVDGGFDSVGIGVPGVSNSTLSVGKTLTDITNVRHGAILSINFSSTTNTAFELLAVLAATEFAAAHTADLTGTVGLRGIQTRHTANAAATGTVTGAAGLYVTNFNDNAGAFVVTNQYGVFMEALTTGVNNYGIFINTPTGTIADAIHVVGGRTFLGGSVAIGAGVGTVLIDYTATDGARQFEVSGTGTYNGGTSVTSARVSPISSIVPNTFTVTNLASMDIFEPIITLQGSGAVTNAVTLRVVNAPTEGTNNYAFWVDQGNSRFDGNIALNGAFVIQAETSTEIGFTVSNAALTLGSLGSIVVPVKTDTGAPNDAAFGNLNGAFGFNSFDNTLEVRNGVDTFLSVGVAGIVMQRKAPVIGSMDGWYHPQQYLDGSLRYVDESRCIQCGEEMQPGDKIGLYANGRVRNDDLHAIYGHDHIELSPHVQELERRLKDLEEALAIAS